MKKRLRDMLLLLACVIGCLVLTAILLVQLLFPPKTILGETDEDRYIQIDSDYYMFGSYSDDDFLLLELAADDGPAAISTKGYFIYDDVYFFVPSDDERSEFTLKFVTSSFGIVRVNGKVAVSDLTRVDFSDGAILSFGGRELKLHLVRNCLPSIVVDTLDGEPVYSRSDFVACLATIIDEGSVVSYKTVSDIRLRGNTTSWMPKHPFKLKLSEPIEFDGILADELNLLANFADPSMLRNAVAFELAEHLEMPYTPAAEYYDVYLNGEYQGVYTASLPIDPLENGMEFQFLSDNAETGCFMIELDFREGSQFTDLGVGYTYISPKKPNALQQEYICVRIQELEAALQSEDDRAWLDYIDATSFVDYYLVQEITANIDAANPLSVFVYTDEQGRFCAGPVWDFDLGFGSTDPTNYGGLYMTSAWWYSYLTSNPVFVEMVEARYQEIRPYLNSLVESISQKGEKLSEASVGNFLVTYSGMQEEWREPDDNFYDSSVEEVKNWLEQRILWLDDNLIPTLKSKSIG